MLVLRKENSLPNFVNEIFNEFAINNRNWATGSMPSVNIKEGKDAFVVDVAAPGLSKEDFKVLVENNLLTVSVNKEVVNNEDDSRYTLCEFSYNSFSRSFKLPQTIDVEKINASHNQGVLSISIPKREEAKLKPVREIEIE